MYIKRYTVAAFILMGLVGGYIYSYVTKGTATLDFFGVPLPALSIAVWVLVPLFILYIASVLHMSFYSLLGKINLRKYEKDYDKIVDLIVDTYLNKKHRSYSFKTDRYKLLGTLLENTALFPIADLKGRIKNEKIDAVLKLIDGIKNGDVVDLKAFNLLDTNELLIQNERNKLKSGELTPESILSNSTKYADVLRTEAFTAYTKRASLQNIEKYKTLLNKESLYNILARVNADENTLEISNEDLVSFISSVPLTTDDYIKLSSVISTSGMIPEQRIKLFEMLSEANEEVTPAYLYTLFDLEMLAPADEILENSQEEEYQNFKAYRALKECNKNFSIELFV
jgi:hypothetical protein